MGRLDGKVALISGGARGQGAAEARMFASEGACVLFGDILDDEGRRVEAEILELGGQATYIHLDVTQEADWAAAVNRAVSEYGKLDVLVNNAGIVSGSQHRRDDGRRVGPLIRRQRKKAYFWVPGLPWAQCATLAVAASSISHPPPVWSETTTTWPDTAAPRVRCACSPIHGDSARPGWHPVQLGAPGPD